MWVLWGDECGKDEGGVGVEGEMVTEKVGGGGGRGGEGREGKGRGGDRRGGGGRGVDERGWEAMRR